MQGEKSSKCRIPLSDLPPSLEEVKGLSPVSPYRQASVLHSDSPPSHTKHPAGSVYRHASALEPCADSISSSTSAVSGSVEVIVSELENPADDTQTNERMSVKSEEEDMSETEKVIRNIIKQRSGDVMCEKQKPLDLKECITTIIQQRKQESKKLEDQRWQLKQHILEFISQSPTIPREDCDGKAGFTKATEDLDISIPDTEERVGEVKVSNYQSSATHTEQSFRDNSPRQKQSPRIINTIKKTQTGGCRMKMTNRKSVKNALVWTCLSGEENRAVREEVVTALETSDKSNFVLVLSRGLGFAALYAHDPRLGVLVKVIGPSTYPSQILPGQVLATYRYELTTRDFRPLPQRRLTLNTDAITLS